MSTCQWYGVGYLIIMALSGIAFQLKWKDEDWRALVAFLYVTTFSFALPIGAILAIIGGIK